MSDLISREALIEELNEEIDFEIESKSKTGLTAIEAFKIARQRVKKAPAVDAVGVVRCKDCKHRGDAYGCPMYFVLWHGDDIDRTEDEGFCADGARMDGETNER